MNPVRHDAVVVGGGHNGLTCAAYLARAGLDVLVLEARNEVGGCASTVDALDGARVNVCNCDHTLVRATGIIEDLELASHGLRYVEVEPVNQLLGWDGGTPWYLFHDVERTLASLALVHPGEVAGYRRYLDDLLPVAELVLEMTGGAPTARGVGTALVRRRARGLGGLLRLSHRSAADVLRGYFSSEALLGPVATTGPAVWGLPPQAPGSGLGALGYALRHLTPTGRPVGGSGALTDALARALRAAGGTIRTGTRVASVRCGAERVQGVELVGGERIDAPVVVGAGDPRALFVELLDASSPAARRLQARWRSRLGREGYESKLDAVVDVLPRPLGLDEGHLRALEVRHPVLATTVIAPSLAGIAHAHSEATAGRVAERPLILSNVPSLLDPTMVPAGGGHVFSLEVLFTPYRLAGGWTGSPEPERWLAAYASLLEPGFLEGVRRWRLMGPEDYERDFTMTTGHAPSFAGGPLAALAGRDRELTRYATAVPGLYVTGAGTFPGAGVSGAPGRNAAAAVLTDRRRARAPSSAAAAAW